jgi:hypothetical protein
LHTLQVAAHAFEVQASQRSVTLRALSRVQQMQWLHALAAAVQLATENDLLRVAEHIIGDEEHARCTRANAALLQALQQQQQQQQQGGSSSSSNGSAAVSSAGV